MYGAQRSLSDEALKQACPHLNRQEVGKARHARTPTMETLKTELNEPEDGAARAGRESATSRSAVDPDASEWTV